MFTGRRVHILVWVWLRDHKACQTVAGVCLEDACAWMYTHIRDDALDRCMKRVCLCVCLCVCVYKLPVFFSQLCSYTDLWFCVWGVNSRVPVLSLKITLGLKFLAPFSSLLTGTLLTSLYACFSFPFLLFWNSLYPWSLFFPFLFFVSYPKSVCGNREMPQITKGLLIKIQISLTFPKDSPISVTVF